ncbi:MAG: archaeosortase/exosortase family protein [Saprospiraceae bacterium]|nr:archaeosortase/exosortase family protein [Saprospiraceae bacterium]
MGKSNTRKESFSASSLGNWFRDKRPLLLFVAGFTLFLLAFYAFYYSFFFRENWAGPLFEAQAWMTGQLLQLLGLEVSVGGAIISHPDLSVRYFYGCEGLEIMALFGAAILFFPIAFRYKWPGLILGGLALVALNQLRVVVLFIIGLYSREAFEFMHLYGGFALFTLCGIFLWILWLEWATRQKRKREKTNGEKAGKIPA